MISKHGREATCHFQDQIIKHLWLLSWTLWFLLSPELFDLRGTSCYVMEKLYGHRLSANSQQGTKACQQSHEGSRKQILQSQQSLEITIPNQQLDLPLQETLSANHSAKQSQISDSQKLGKVIMFIVLGQYITEHDINKYYSGHLCFAHLFTIKYNCYFIFVLLFVRCPLSS